MPAAAMRPTTTAPTTGTADDWAFSGDFVRLTSAEIAETTSTMTAIDGKYMRRSAATSVAIGRKLDVGPSSRKNHAQRKPTRGFTTTSTTVATNMAVTIAI